MVAKRVPTSEKVNSLIKFAKVYSGVDEKSNVILWTGTATTTSGVATLYLTDDGTATGIALFTNIFSIQAIAEANVVEPEQIPLASIKSLSADKKTLVINVIIAASPKSIFAPDDTKVYVTVIGD